VGTGYWSQSTCRSDTLWYGVPGQGTWYYTARWGQYWVGGGVYQTYARQGFECSALGPPVKDYQYLSEFASYGQWFLGGAIWFNGTWHVSLGDFGQTAGRLDGIELAAPDGTPRPPEHDEMVTDAAKVGPDVPDDLAAETGEGA
jgi:hypothetical protein